WVWPPDMVTVRASVSTPPPPPPPPHAATERTSAALETMVIAFVRIDSTLNDGWISQYESVTRVTGQVLRRNRARRAVPPRRPAQVDWRVKKPSEWPRRARPSASEKQRGRWGSPWRDRAWR